MIKIKQGWNSDKGKDYPDFFGCFVCFDLLWIRAESAVSPAEKKCYFGFDSGKKCEF